MQKIHSFIHCAVRFAAFFIISIFSSQCFAQSSVSEKSLSSFQYLKQFNAIFDFVQQNYVDEVEAKILYEGAVKGLLNAFNDPYTSYLDSNTIRDLADTTNGKFGGVGLTISKPVESTAKKPAYVEVGSPIEDSPGAKAGILSGDYITAIDGQPTVPMTMEEVLSKLRGQEGTPVTISILRGESLTFDVKLVRAMIEVPTIKHAMIGSTGYVRLIQFTPETAERLQEALDLFEKSGYKNLIVDVRDNPGGLISSAHEVADKFIDNGLIVSTKSRIRGADSKFFADVSKTTVRGKPIIVLINRGSASASEIVAGALKDHHLAYLVGERTFGKGSVQQVIPIGEKEEMKITIARYYTPSDVNIDKIGIPPDREIAYPPLTKENEDAYAKLMKEDEISAYVDSNKNMSEAQIADFAQELSKKYNLDIRLLRRLVRIRVWRLRPSEVYDLDYDIQLNEALKILNETNNFAALLTSTKTLKELQAEAEKNVEKEKTELHSTGLQAK